MIGASIGCYFALILLRVSIGVILPIVIVFVIGTAGVLLLITFEGFREEETRDCYKLSELHNKLKEESKH